MKIVFWIFGIIVLIVSFVLYFGWKKKFEGETETLFSKFEKFKEKQDGIE